MREIDEQYKSFKQMREDIVSEIKIYYENQEKEFNQKHYSQRLSEQIDAINNFIDKETKYNLKIKLMSNQQAIKREVVQTIKNSIRIQFPSSNLTKLKDNDLLNFNPISNINLSPIGKEGGIGGLLTTTTKQQTIPQGLSAFGLQAVLSAKRNLKFTQKKATVYEEIEKRISDQIQSAHSQSNATDMDFFMGHQRKFQRTILDINRNKYKGDVEVLPGGKEPVKSGKGEMWYVDGSYYNGEWKHNKRFGYGEFQTTAKDKYEGYWFDDQKQGKGKIEYFDGRMYEGEWKFDQQQGFGVMKDPDGYFYEGDWNQSLPHGHGFAFFKDGSRYTGSFNQGERSGYGVNTFKDGSEYEGEWMKDMPHGQGMYKFSDGRIYVGKFECGKKHGHGELTRLNGDVVEGDWLNDALVKIVREDKP